MSRGLGRASQDVALPNDGFLPKSSVQFTSVTQSFQTLCDPWTAAHQASLTITNSQSLLKLKSIESVMPSNHLILCQRQGSLAGYSSWGCKESHD